MIIFAIAWFGDVDPAEYPLLYLFGLIELFVEIAVFLVLIVVPVLEGL